MSNAFSSSELRRALPRLLVALALLAVASSACDEPLGQAGGSGASGGEGSDPEPSSPAGVAIRVILDAQLDSVRHGDGAAFARAMSPNAFVFGPFAAHTLTNRAHLTTAIGETFRQYLEPQREASVTRMQSRMGTAEGGRAGWAFERISVVARGVETMFAVSTLLVREGSAWRIAAQTWASPVRDDLAIDLASGGGFPAPAPLEENVGPGTASIRAHVRAFVAGRETWPSEGRTDSMMIGSAPGELTRGDEAIGAQVTRAHSGGVRIEQLGGVTTRRVGDGSVGFAAWTGALVLPRHPPVRLPVRSFDIFVREGSGYRIVLKHVSLGAPGFREGEGPPQTAPARAPATGTDTETPPGADTPEP